MASSLVWARAADLLGLPRAPGWPAMLEPMQCAALQAGLATAAELREARLIDATLSDTCRAGKITCEAAQRLAQVTGRHVVGALGPGFVRQPRPVHTVQTYRIAAPAFVAWLRTQGETPSEHITAWVEATAPEPAPGVVPGTPKTWTPERLGELRAYRAAHGTKQAAARFGVSEARVRVLLPSDKPQPKGYSAFNSDLK